MRTVTRAAAIVMAALIGYMSAGAAAWAFSPSPTLTAEQAREDVSLVTGLTREQLSVQDTQTGSPASTQRLPFATPRMTEPWWQQLLLGSDEYGATGYSSEIVTSRTWSALDAEQRLRAGGWTTRLTHDGDEVTITATSPRSTGAFPRELSLSAWHSSLRVDLLRASPTALHASLLCGAALGAASAIGLAALTRGGGRRPAPPRTGPRHRSSTLTEIAAAAGEFCSVVGALAAAGLTVLTVVMTAPVWTSPYGAAAVAPWAPVMAIGVRQLFIVCLVLLAVAWLLRTRIATHPPLVGLTPSPRPQT